MEKQTALKLVTDYKNRGLVFARSSEIEDIPQQYEPIVTVVQFSKRDFADVGKGAFYPLKSATNRIADAAGVGFSDVYTRVKGDWGQIEIVAHKDGSFEAKGDYAIIGRAKGYRTGPDGNPRYGEAEYEFNVCDRCNLEKYYGKYPPKNLREARKALYEMKKFATQRASTGAKLGVIRDLVGLPSNFNSQDIGRPMVFSQVVESNIFKLGITRELMKTGEGKRAIADSMFGAKQLLYGTSHEEKPSEIHADGGVTHDTFLEEEPEDAHESNQEEDFPPDYDEPLETEDDEVIQLKVTLSRWLDSGKIRNPNNIAKLEKLINDPGATVEDLKYFHKALEERYGGVA